MNMKRKISLMLAVILVCSCLCGAALAASVGVVRTLSQDGTVNLRANPNSYVIGNTENGDLLKIIKKSSGWSRVTMTSGAMRGRTGWMFNKYVLNLRDTADSSGWGALAHIKTEYATSGVNLRKGPGMSYGVKGTLHRNDMLIILDKYNSRWYEVQIGNSLRTGFVSSEYITNGAIAHTTSSVNLRRKASDSSEILNVVPSGEEVLVLNIGSKWAKVKYERRTGYIFTKYLRLK